MTLTFLLVVLGIITVLGFSRTEKRLIDIYNQLNSIEKKLEKILGEDEEEFDEES